jgi:HAD superfamily hydrolase (TIGR01490 family)
MKDCVVAAFDFDGTLTERDSLLPFLSFVSSPIKVTTCLCAMTPRFLGYSLGMQSRQDLKEVLLTHFLRDTPEERAKNLGENFAREKLPMLITAQRWARVQWHLQRGDRCILVSANLDLYLKPWGMLAGFETVIASKCAISPQGRLTGRLAGKNCWGAEKARRLRQLLSPREHYILYAYGDSLGDKEMLDMADYPLFI